MLSLFFRVYNKKYATHKSFYISHDALYGQGLSHDDFTIAHHFSCGVHVLEKSKIQPFFDWRVGIFWNVYSHLRLGDADFWQSLEYACEIWSLLCVFDCVWNHDGSVGKSREQSTRVYRSTWWYCRFIFGIVRRWCHPDKVENRFVMVGYGADGVPDWSHHRVDFHHIVWHHQDVPSRMADRRPHCVRTFDCV